MPKRIFWDTQTGTVFWQEGDEVAFAPMNNDNTSDLDCGGVVEIWSEDGKEAAKAEEARIKAAIRFEKNNAICEKCGNGYVASEGCKNCE